MWIKSISGNTCYPQSITSSNSPFYSYEKDSKTLKEVWHNITSLPLPNYADKDIQSYLKLLCINCMDFNDQLVVILQFPLLDKSHTMNVYKVYNLPAFHPALWKTFHYSMEVEHLVLSSKPDYATIPLEHSMLMCVFSRRQVLI